MLVLSQRERGVPADTVHTGCVLQPVKINCCRSNVIMQPQTIDKSGSSIDDMLIRREGRVWQSCEQRIAVIKPRGHQRGNEISGHIAAE